MNPDTATVAEMRDWLAVHKHHERLRAMGSAATTDDFYRDPEPIPPTLDAAAAAMPEGWTWTRQCFMEGWPHLTSVLQWRAAGWVHKDTDDATVKAVVVDDTGDEIADRLRLACKCILAEEAKR